jgi:hypothetical protein
VRTGSDATAIGLVATNIALEVSATDIVKRREILARADQGRFDGFSKRSHEREPKCQYCGPGLYAKLIKSGARGTANLKGFYRYTREEAKRWEERFREFSFDVRRLSSSILRAPQINAIA